MWWLGNSRPYAHAWQWNVMSNMGGFIIPLAIWSAFWTGFALWHAAKRDEKWWFLFFLLIHTAGIVEILYLIFVAKTLGQSGKAVARRRTRKRSR